MKKQQHIICTSPASSLFLFASVPAIGAIIPQYLRLDYPHIDFSCAD